MSFQLKIMPDLTVKLKGNARKHSLSLRNLKPFAGQLLLFADVIGHVLFSQRQGSVLSFTV
ncbi:MAG: hypothetical protein WC701_07055 [Kiritimatiellales bacterium]